MMERALRSLVSAFRWPASGGLECRRLEAEGETERGGVDVGDPAHSVASCVNISPLLALGSQEVILSVDVAVSIDVPVAGLGDDGCVMIDNGASILKIWSSDCGGP
jgi:hypothetical protein